MIEYPDFGRPRESRVTATVVVPSDLMSESVLAMTGARHEPDGSWLFPADRQLQTKDVTLRGARLSTGIQADASEGPLTMTLELSATAITAEDLEAVTDSAVDQMTPNAYHWVVSEAMRKAPGLSMLTEEAHRAIATIALRAINEALPDQGVALWKNRP